LNLSADNLEEILLLMPSNLKQTDKKHLRSLNNLHHINVNNNNNDFLNSTIVNEIDTKINDNQLDYQSKANNEQQQQQQLEQIKNESIQVYFKRWIILLVFCSITLLNAFNWIEYSIIQDVVIQFYNESLPKGKAEQYDATNWLSMVYMLTYIPLVFPAMFLLDRKGLRLSCTLGALLTAVGAILKCAAVKPNLFPVAMLAQTICGIAQSFTLGIPARLSALWFGPTEIATATSVIRLL
jgi:hypothetical protein